MKKQQRRHWMIKRIIRSGNGDTDWIHTLSTQSSSRLKWTCKWTQELMFSQQCSWNSSVLGSYVLSMGKALLTFQRVLMPVPSESSSPSPLLKMSNCKDEMTAILPKFENPTTHSNIKKEFKLHANKPLGSMTISN